MPRRDRNCVELLYPQRPIILQCRADLSEPSSLLSTVGRGGVAETDEAGVEADEGKEGLREAFEVGLDVGVGAEERLRTEGVRLEAGVQLRGWKTYDRGRERETSKLHQCGRDVGLQPGVHRTRWRLAVVVALL